MIALTSYSASTPIAAQGRTLDRLKEIARVVPDATAHLRAYWALLRGGTGRTPPTPSPDRSGLLSSRPRNSENYFYRVRRGGDPQVGTLIFIRQLHAPPNFELSAAALDPLAKLQAAVYRELCRLSPTHVFKEALTHDQPPLSHETDAETRRWLDQKREEVRQLFGGGIVDETHPLYKAQRDYLCDLKRGPAWIYYFLRDDVSLHATIDEAGMMAVGWLQPEVAAQRWEDWAEEHVRRFFAARPGETAVIIFGAAHELDFSPPADEGTPRRRRRPVIHEVGFPRLTKAYEDAALEEQIAAFVRRMSR